MDPSGGQRMAMGKGHSTKGKKTPRNVTSTEKREKNVCRLSKKSHYRLCQKNNSVEKLKDFNIKILLI